MHEETPGEVAWAWDGALAHDVRTHGWVVYEHDLCAADEDAVGPIEARVAGSPAHFDRYVAFEREAMYEGAGHRHLLAERAGAWPRPLAEE